jgi:TPR repeat protein
MPIKLMLRFYGMCFDLSKGRPGNNTKALKYFQRAAALGSPDGQFLTALSLPLNSNESKNYLKSAIEQQQPFALLRKGWGLVTKGKSGAAVKMFKQLADQGSILGEDH